MSAQLRRRAAITALVTFAVIVGASGASAQSDPYQTGTIGYDVSYPQCGAARPTGAFAVVGVNGGQPFNFNRCLAAEYSLAPSGPAPSLYINTGYSGAYFNNITSNCSSASQPCQRNERAETGVGDRL